MNANEPTRDNEIEIEDIIDNNSNDSEEEIDEFDEDDLETSLMQNEEVLDNLVLELNDMLTNMVTTNEKEKDKEKENDDVESVSGSEGSLDDWLQELSASELSDFIAMIYCKIEDYIQTNVRQMYTESFHSDLLNYLTDEVDDILVEIDMDTVSNEEIAYVCELYCYQYFDHTPLVPCRSLPSNLKSRILDGEDLENSYLEKTIEWLNSIRTPDQRTNEWYQFRANLITASNIWQVFVSEASRNRLIYEKCNVTTATDGTISTQVYSNNNTNSPMHWGIKYEPLTVMIYEKINNTKVGQFGCIPHDTYSCIGASPDGINIDKESPLYGRMLEIKNIFNREITGTPKDAYWIQMQVQMETCKLNECDFVESRFKEYESAAAFYADLDKSESLVKSLPGSGSDQDSLFKGVVLMLNHKETNQIQYVFMPLSVPLTKPDIEEWIKGQEEVLSKEYIIQQVQYWWLDEWSCVLVLRNEYWFKSVVHEIVETWDIILRERVTGFSHRTPKKRTKLHDDLLNTMNTTISKDVKVIQLGK